MHTRRRYAVKFDFRCIWIPFVLHGCLPGQQQFTNAVYLKNNSNERVECVLKAGHGNSVSTIIEPKSSALVGVLLSKREIGAIHVKPVQGKAVLIKVQASESFGDNIIKVYP